MLFPNRYQSQSLDVGSSPSDADRWCANADRCQTSVNIVPNIMVVWGMLCLHIIVDPSRAETITMPIASAQDDVEELLGEDLVSFDSSDLELGTQILPFNLGTFRQSVGLRFLDIGIPPGSTISSASIQFMVDEPSSVDTSLRIYGELAPNSAPFMEVTGNVTDRAGTNSVLWSDIPPWTNEGDSGPEQQTPDLAAIVQDIINQPGWAAGNAMTFVIDPEPIDNNTSFRVAKAFDEASGNPNFDPPIFNVEFVSAPEPSTLDFNNDSHVDVLDVDSLVGEIVAGTHGGSFDLTGEGTVDDADLTEWAFGSGRPQCIQPIILGR